MQHNYTRCNTARLPQVLQRTHSLSRSERWLATFAHLVPPVVAALPSRAAVSELVAELERGPVLEDRRPRELDDLRRGRTRRRTRRSLSAARHGERGVRTRMLTAGRCVAGHRLGQSVWRGIQRTHSNHRSRPGQGYPWCSGLSSQAAQLKHVEQFEPPTLQDIRTTYNMPH